VRGGKLNSKW